MAARRHWPLVLDDPSSPPCRKTRATAASARQPTVAAWPVHDQHGRPCPWPVRDRGAVARLDKLRRTGCAARVNHGSRDIAPPTGTASAVPSGDRVMPFPRFVRLVVFAAPGRAPGHGNGGRSHRLIEGRCVWSVVAPCPEGRAIPVHQSWLSCRRTLRTEVWSGRRGSNSRHSAWKADALPTELLPPGIFQPRAQQGEPR